MIFPTPAIKAQPRTVSFPGADSRPGIGRGPAGVGFLVSVAAGVVHACSLFFLAGRRITNAAEFFGVVRNG